jgi:hypothetical protein
MIGRMLKWLKDEKDRVDVRIQTAALAETAVEKAKQYAPVDTGELKASIGYELTPNGEEALIYATAPHAIYVTDGTKPHVIEARNGQALKFIGAAGAPVYRRRVNHPGTKPNRFLERAIAETIAEQSRTLGLRDSLRRIFFGDRT